MAGVSIVVAVYNIAPYVGRCLESLMVQTHREIEVIVVDDGSTDGSHQVAESLSLLDERILVVRKENGGLSDARNYGLRLAKMPYVMFIDGDDWVEADMVEVMLSAAQEAKFDVVMAGCFVDFHYSDDEMRVSEIQLPQEVRIDPTSPVGPPVTAELTNLLGYAWNKLYRRDFLLAGRHAFVVGLPLVEDAVFNSAVFTSQASVAVIPAAFVHYVQRPRSTLGTIFRSRDLHLLLTSIECKARVLRCWRCDESAVRLMETNLAIDALTGAVRVIALDRHLTFRAKRDAAKEVLGGATAAEIMRLIAADAGIDHRRELLKQLLLKQRSLLLVILLSAWHRRRGYP